MSLQHAKHQISDYVRAREKIHTPSHRQSRVTVRFESKFPSAFVKWIECLDLFRSFSVSLSCYQLVADSMKQNSSCKVASIDHGDGLQSGMDLLVRFVLLIKLFLMHIIYKEVFCRESLRTFGGNVRKVPAKNAAQHLKNRSRPCRKVFSRNGN